MKNHLLILDMMVCERNVSPYMCVGTQMAMLLGEVIEPLRGKALGEEV